MRLELCSFTGAKTRELSGRLVAIELSSRAVDVPSATWSGGTDNNRAMDARASCASVSQLPNPKVPLAQAVVIWVTASTAAGHGIPKLAVLRYPGVDFQGASVMAVVSP